MRSKIKYLVLLFLVMFTMTGCVKFNATMEVKKDKSMTFTAIYAISKEYSEEDLFDEDAKNQMKESGFTVEDYEQDNYKGVTLTKKYDNIDNYSSTDDVEYNLSDGLTNNDVKIFTIKKGFFKNSYKANFVINTDMEDVSDTDTDSDVSLNNDDNLLALEEEPVITTSDENAIYGVEADDYYYDYDTDYENELGDIDYGELEDYADMMEGMEMKFTIKLPYAATKTNASTNINNKEMTWDLTSSTDGIQFEFEMYNIGNIALVCGGALLVVAVIVVIVLKKSKKTDKMIENI